MAIDFSSLPQDNPFSIPKPGLYLVKIIKAESKPPKDVSKPEYLECVYALTDAHGKACGNFTDRFFESESDVVKFKLGRFVKATGIPITGMVEFRDLAKILVNRTLVVDIKNVKDDYNSTPEKEVLKAEVDIFSREAYYNVSEFASLTGTQQEPAPDAAPDDTGNTPDPAANY